MMDAKPLPSSPSLNKFQPYGRMGKDALRGSAKRVKGSHALDYAGVGRPKCRASGGAGERGGAAARFTFKEAIRATEKLHMAINKIPCMYIWGLSAQAGVRSAPFAMS